MTRTWRSPTVEDESSAAIAPAESDTEIVLGIEVRKNRNCTVQRHYIQGEEGTIKEAYSCEPNDPPEHHPYWDYDIDALKSLSYSDAKAAEILAVRVMESRPREAMDLMIRSAALSDNPRPLFWLAQASYSALTVEDMKTRYVLLSVAERMGYEAANATYWRDQLVGSAVSEADLDDLEGRVAEVLESMRRIKNEVGASSPAEENSNA